MLDERDISTIREMIDGSEDRMTEKIAASEERMSKRIDESIEASEARMSKRIDESIAASEDRMSKKIDDLRDEMYVLFETKIMPNFQLLAEGQQTLLETLAPKSRVEALEEDVSVLKQAVRSMNQDIMELKKAQ